MINTEKIEMILNKKKDRTAALLEVLNLTAQLCNISKDTFNNNFNLSLDKVSNLLELDAQSRRTTGYILKSSDYKTLGIFQNHIEKLRRKSKKSPKLISLLKLMPKLYRVKLDKGLNYAELQKYASKKYKINCSRTYFIKIFKTINI